MSRVGKAAKVSGAVLGAAIVVAVPTFAAAVSAQADDAEVNPAIRAAVVNSALAQPSGGPLGAHVAVGIPIPVAPAPGVAVAAPAQAAAANPAKPGAPEPAVKEGCLAEGTAEARQEELPEGPDRQCHGRCSMRIGPEVDYWRHQPRRHNRLGRVSAQRCGNTQALCEPLA